MLVVLPYFGRFALVSSKIQNRRTERPAVYSFHLISKFPNKLKTLLGQALYMKNHADTKDSRIAGRLRRTLFDRLQLGAGDTVVPNAAKKLSSKTELMQNVFPQFYGKERPLVKGSGESYEWTVTQQTLLNNSS